MFSCLYSVQFMRHYRTTIVFQTAKNFYAESSKPTMWCVKLVSL